MRLGWIARLISRKTEEQWLKEQPCYLLFAYWIKANDQAENLGGSSIFSAPLQYLYGRLLGGPRALERNRDRLWQELTVRYDGLVRQWAKRNTLSQKQAINRALQSHKNAHIALLSASQLLPQDLPIQLCEAVARSFGRNTALERKFYLRAFMDELPRSSACSSVTDALFNEQYSAMSSTEFRQHLAYVSMDLHRHFLAMGTAVDQWTNGKISEQEIARADLSGAPAAMYADWLLA